MVPSSDVYHPPLFSAECGRIHNHNPGYPGQNRVKCPLKLAFGLTRAWVRCHHGSRWRAAFSSSCTLASVCFCSCRTSLAINSRSKGGGGTYRMRCRRGHICVMCVNAVCELHLLPCIEYGCLARTAGKLLVHNGLCQNAIFERGIYAFVLKGISDDHFATMFTKYTAVLPASQTGTFKDEL